MTIIGCSNASPEKQVHKVHVQIEQTVEEPNIVIEIETKEQIPNISREDAIIPLMQSVNQLIESRVPFDEPRTEVGQEDGTLRLLWEQAWRGGKNTYEHNGDTYYVFSNKGKPIPPQVCADFIVDAFDIACGSWYQKYYKRRWRDHTHWNLHDDVKDSGYDPRRVAELIDYFGDKPDLFSEEYRDDGENHILLSDKHKSRALFQLRQLQQGDIVFIRGSTPWDKKKEHWHSFFVYEYDNEKDNWKIAGNASMAAVRWITTEGRRTPKRYIEGIWRPTDKLLSSYF